MDQVRTYTVYPSWSETTALLAPFAEGVGAMWRTGESAHDNAVKSALGIEPDDLTIGFIYAGTDVDSGSGIL